MSLLDDAEYVDLRDGKTKKGSELSCGRTNRSESRHGPKNLRVYRAMRKTRKKKNGEIVSKGRRSIRRQRYAIRPGDKVLIVRKEPDDRKTRRWSVVTGVHNNGKKVVLTDGTIATSKIRKVIHTGGWRQRK